LPYGVAPAPSSRRDTECKDAPRSTLRRDVSVLPTRGRAFEPKGRNPTTAMRAPTQQASILKMRVIFRPADLG
jgi:hypothetical protein